VNENKQENNRANVSETPIPHEIFLMRLSENARLVKPRSGVISSKIDFS
jgi:hypothetical protein